MTALGHFKCNYFIIYQKIKIFLKFMLSYFKRKHEKTENRLQWKILGIFLMSVDFLFNIIIFLFNMNENFMFVIMRELPTLINFNSEQYN